VDDVFRPTPHFDISVRAPSHPIAGAVEAVRTERPPVVGFGAKVSVECVGSAHEQLAVVAVGDFVAVVVDDPQFVVVLSLGLGLTLLVAIALIDGSLQRQLTRAMPDQGPSFFFLDVPSASIEPFTAFLKKEVPQATIESVPASNFSGASA